MLVSVLPAPGCPPQSAPLQRIAPVGPPLRQRPSWPKHRHAAFAPAPRRAPSPGLPSGLLLALQPCRVASGLDPSLSRLGVRRPSPFSSAQRKPRLLGESSSL